MKFICIIWSFHIFIITFNHSFVSRLSTHTVDRCGLFVAFVTLRTVKRGSHICSIEFDAPNVNRIRCTLLRIWHAHALHACVRSMKPHVRWYTHLETLHRRSLNSMFRGEISALQMQSKHIFVIHFHMESQIWLACLCVIAFQIPRSIYVHRSMFMRFRDCEELVILTIFENGNFAISGVTRTQFFNGVFVRTLKTFNTMFEGASSSEVKRFSLQSRAQKLQYHCALLALKGKWMWTAMIALVKTHICRERENVNSDKTHCEINITSTALRSGERVTSAPSHNHCADYFSRGDIDFTLNNK